jgi:predicted nucleic acid-binding protein
MRVLLDTNIIIHREATKIINKDIGILFNWFDKLHYEKCIHPLSLYEIRKHSDEDIVKTIEAKVKNYNMLKTEAPEVEEIIAIRSKYDRNENDGVDTSLLKEVFCKRVHYLITEDRNIHLKATDLGIAEVVFTIDDFFERVTAENPTLTDYKTLSVRKEYFGNININDPFFDSFKEDYNRFEDWFNSKADEIAYICQSDNNDILAFLYVKVEGEDENYRDINPVFTPKRRLKIGTFKVISNGFKLGERYLKIVFDNALNNKVDEIYVTLFDTREEHERLIGLFEDWGFEYYGVKSSLSGDERVYVKNFKPVPNDSNPKRTYPFIKKDRRYFIVPIKPEYHTELLPDSILNNESPKDFVENAPHRNAIQKVYISRSMNRDLIPGDIIIFYRTGGRYKSVTTTIGIIESVIIDITDENEFIGLCRKRSVFSDNKLIEFWNQKSSYGKWYKPFIVNFLYLYSFPKRLNMEVLINLGVIADVQSAPRGFEQITLEQFEKILEASNTDESFIIN